MKNPAIQNGLFYGLASVIITLVLYLIDPNLLFNMTIGLLVGFGLAIFFMVRACRTERANNEGILTFAEGLKCSFIVYAIGALISAIFLYIMYNFVDAGLADMEKQVAIDAVNWTMDLMKAPEDARAQALADIEDQNFQRGPASILTQWGFSLIFGLILALVIGMVTKKETRV